MEKRQTIKIHLKLGRINDEQGFIYENQIIDVFTEQDCSIVEMDNMMDYLFTKYCILPDYKFLHHGDIEIIKLFIEELNNQNKDARESMSIIQEASTLCKDEDIVFPELFDGQRVNEAIRFCRDVQTDSKIQDQLKPKYRKIFNLSMKYLSKVLWNYKGSKEKPKEMEATTDDSSEVHSRNTVNSSDINQQLEKLIEIKTGSNIESLVEIYKGYREYNDFCEYLEKKYYNCKLNIYLMLGIEIGIKKRILTSRYDALKVELRNEHNVILLCKYVIDDITPSISYDILVVLIKYVLFNNGALESNNINGKVEFDKGISMLQNEFENYLANQRYTQKDINKCIQYVNQAFSDKFFYLVPSKAKVQAERYLKIYTENTGEASAVRSFLKFCEEKYNT